MATKNKRRKKQRASADLFQQAQRTFEKGNFKRALKDARVCYRQELSDERHRFLQRVCLARARELYGAGLRAECRALLKGLLEIGVTEPAVEQELPELLVRVGLLDRRGPARQAVSLEADSPLLLSAADHAVLRPGEAPASLPGIRQGASKIRAALQALYSGDESQAVADLSGIARNSPFAEWKYFARGLAAYYRQDTAQTRANWERLAPDRLASRIAAPLGSLADPALADRGDPQVKRGLSKIASEVLGGPILADLHQLRTHVAADRWKNVMRSLRTSHPAIRRFDPGLSQRIVTVLYYAILRKGSRPLLAELASIVGPLPMDPCWNRAWALMWEHRESDDLEQADKHWQRYLKDLAGLPSLSAEERCLAQAMVWHRIGEGYVDECEAIGGRFRGPGGPLAAMQARAAECFENSLRLAPELLSAYQSLAAAQLDWSQPEQAVATYRRLLERFPENFDALRFLALHHVMRDEFLPAREYALRAHRLKPANKETARLAWSAHVGSARHYALQKQWEKGRAEFDAADRVDPSLRKAYYLLARKAVFELKARNFELGEQLAEEAQGQLPEPAPALLALAVEATRYNLSKTAIRGFERQWKAALKKKCSSETAGTMCTAMRAYLGTEVDYPGRSAHLKALLAYVRRCSRVKWRAGDLREVCVFLDGVSDRDDVADQSRLLEKLVEKGRKTFPECPAFHVLAGEIEIKRGPGWCRRRFAESCFQRALERAKTSNDPQDEEIVERAKRGLTFLGEVGPGRAAKDVYYDDDYGDDYDDADEDYDDGTGFAGPPPFDFFGGSEGPFSGALPRDILDTIERMCAELGLDPEEVLGEVAAEMPSSGRAPKPRSPAKREKRKRKKR